MGALIGDCLGAYWEGQSWIGTHPIEKVKETIGEQIRQTTSKKAPVISYTDDSALTFAMAESLVECRGFVAQHMVRRWVIPNILEHRPHCVCEREREREEVLDSKIF